jgi:hypothetical protein
MTLKREKKEDEERSGGKMGEKGKEHYLM